MAVNKLDKMSSGVRVDSDDLKLLIKDLKAAGPAASRGLRTAVKASGEIVATEARQLASAHSQSIPPTIKARAYLSSTKRSLATVTAGRGVPLAALYELGNKGASPSATDFRHPVFERSSATGKLQQTDNWVSQARFPFLLPAAERTGAAVEAQLVAVAEMASKIIAIKRI